eukprot:TRINITY_DN18792_c0_g1_i1.p3 TRINITY_DN18792_c0_g1~~TRINITY_DN18792_c0_g1_i1.p3  ORF type:complete len:128 (-),score=35.64 TRINITY_DN18792_c0_g1_i1:34-417(-)
MCIRDRYQRRVHGTIVSKLKLLESFEGLLSRQIVHDELEKKYIILLDMFKSDLIKVQALFLSGKKMVEEKSSQSPIPVGMPPVSGALNWARGLEERIREPMEKLNSSNKAIQAVSYTHLTLPTICSV